MKQHVTTLAVALSIGALFTAPDARAQHTRYWVGGTGDWSDGAHWAALPNGPGGSGAPGVSDDVVITARGTTGIHLDRDAACASLSVDATHGTFSLTGDERHPLRVDHDLHLSGDVHWDMTGTLRFTHDNGGAEIDARGIPVHGDVRFEGSGAWSMLTDLVVDDARSITLREGSLMTNGNTLRAGSLIFESNRPKRLFAGASAVLLAHAYLPGEAIGIVEQGNSHLIVGTAEQPWGAAAHPARDEDRGINTCGTGTGQTPFTINAQVLSNFNGFNVSCSGACDAVVTVSVTGGVGPFTYSWSPGGPSGPLATTWNNTCVGTKLVVVTDLGQGIGCATTVQVTGPAPLSVIFFPALTPPACADVCNGSGNALAVGGTGVGYTYNWNNGAGSSSTFNALCAGQNSLRITDLNLCHFDTLFNINLLPISPNLVVTPAQCNGGCDGSATVTPAGGTGTLTVNWEPGTPVGDGTTTVHQLCAGNYSVTIVDANGCDTTLQFQITQPPPIVPNAVITNATCADLCNGQAVLSPSGATGPFTYNWTPAPGGGQGTNTATGLCARTYQCLITDQATGCDTLVNIVVGSPPALSVQLTVNDVSCSDACDGTAVAQVSGGTPGYSYLWNPAPAAGQGTPNASGLCPGNYTLTVSDVAGCDTTLQFTVGAPQPITPNVSNTTITCHGVCDGSITVAPTGGTGAFTFNWTPDPPNGDGTNTATQLCAGTWSVLITDAHGCDTLVTVTLNEPPALVVTPSQTNVTCGGNCDGTATGTVGGGTAGYTYLWTPAPGGGQGTPTATGLCAGAYTLLVTDANGCTISTVFNILPATPINVQLQLTNATCPDFCNGAAVATVTGGSGSFTYAWTPAPGTGQGTNSVTGLCAQAYALTVTDALGCDTTINFTITAPLPVDPHATQVNATCFGSCNGSITLAPTGGTGSYIYTWNPIPSNGQGHPMALNLCAGVWTVNIASGVCDTTLTFTITQPPPIVPGLVVTPVSCANLCDGTATASASGGSGGFAYNWSPAPGGGQGTPNATGLCPGNYSLTITDAANCDTTISFTITAPPPLAPSVVTTLASCGGGCDGTATLTVTGGTGALVIVWSPSPGTGQGTTHVTDLCPGGYSVTVSDANGCDTTLQFTINTPSGISAVPTVTPASCADVCNGAISLAVSGGVPNYTFAWAPPPPGGGGASVTGLCPGQWTVTIGDQAGCDTVLVMNVTSPPPIIPNGVFTNETCNGPCDGTATVAPTGGTGNFSYAWTPQPGTGQGTPSVTGLCAGDWSVTITDAGGCDTVWTFTVLPEQPILATITGQDATCYGVCNGSAVVNASGGSGGFTYQWTPTPNGGQGTNTVTGLCLGLWSVTVTDINDCDTTVSVLISKPSAITPSFGLNSANCTGPCTGQAAVFPSGGTGGYTFLWQPDPIVGQGTFFADSLCVGVNYSITITDSNGCDTVTTFTIPDYAPIVPGLTTVNPTCHGACNGSATLAPSGGLPGYTYDWSPDPLSGDGTAAVTGLCAGSYSVVITDASGCDTTVAFTITEPTAITANVGLVNITCAGQCNGSITLGPSGGVGPYSFVWTPQPPAGQGTNSISQLCAGTWNVTIADATGCDTTLSFTLVDPAPLVVLPEVQPSHCQLCDGAITMHTSGGGGNYFYVWGPPINVTGTDSVQGNLCAGLYQVIVGDALGCVQQFTVPVSDSNGEQLLANDDLLTCPGNCDGVVSVAYNCSAPVCNVEWFDGFGTDLGISTDSLTNLCAGIYYVRVINGSGCTTFDTAQVIAPQPILVTFGTTPVTCAGACDGTAGLGISGGVPSYTIDWAPAPAIGQGTPNVSGLCAGPYTATVTDASGCSVVVDVLITEPAPIDANAAVQDVQCHGQCDGSITLSATGGTGAFVYVWNPVPPNGQGTNAATQLCAGLWSVTVIDVNGCSAAFSYQINEPPALGITTSASGSHCQQCDGTLTANVSGGSGSSSVTWTNANGAQIGTGNALTGICAGVYTATVVDANGCTASAIAVVSDVDGEALTVTDGNTTCANQCDGAVSVSFTCQAGPCAITWYDATAQVIAQNQFTVPGLCIGDYLVQVVNGGGCITIDTAHVTPSQQIIPNLSSSPVTCAGACDGTAALGPVGGLAPYTYTWAPPPPVGQGTSSVSGLCAGVWTVTIADSTGCDTTVQVLITEPSAIDALGQVTNASCAGVCDGAISVVASGGTGPYTYSWVPNPPVGQGTNSVAQLCAGTWQVTITDAHGCDSTFFYPVFEPFPLTITTSSTLSTCGVCSGSAIVSAQGGTLDYSYAWTSGGALFGTNDTLSTICAGLYQVTVTDAHGCQAQASVPVSDVDSEQLTMQNDIVTCPGSCDGEVAVAFNCSAPTCTIAWFDALGSDLGEPNNTLDSLCAGSYFVLVTNGNGCVTIDTAFVTEPPPLVPNLSTVQPNCAGSCDGSATVGPTGGIAPYTYLWTPAPPIGQGTAQADSLCAGTWNVLITDSVGCSLSLDVLLLEPQPVTAAGVITPITCHGSCDGAIVVTPSGGSGSFTYAWQPPPPVGQGTGSVSQLCPGDWSVTITDGHGCDTTYTFTVTDPPQLVATITTVDNICYGDCSGEAHVLIAGGQGPYTNVWTDINGNPLAQNDTSLFDLCAGGYQLLVTDLNGCTIQQVFSIGQGNPIMAALVFQGETCQGPCDATASVSPSGGNGVFTVTWTDPNGNVFATGNTLNGACAGNWTVNVADSAGCDTTIAFTLLPYTPIAPNATVTPISCNGSCDASIVLAPAGGIGTLTYAWVPVPPNGDGTASATGLCPNTWSVTITDAAGCDTTVSFTITDPPAITIVVDAVADASCATAADGAISTTVGGGTPGLTIAWTGPGGFNAATDDITGLLPGAYVITVTDAHGCSLQQPVNVGALSTVHADAGPDMVHCQGAPLVLDGSASQGATGYTWSDAQGNTLGNNVTLDLGSPAAGSYTFILTASDGPCSDQDTVVVDVLALPLADAGPDQSIFLGATATLGGAPSGPPGSGFVWSPDSLLSAFNVPNPTTSTVTSAWFTLQVTSTDGCISVDSVLITVIPEIKIPSGFTPNGDGSNDAWVIDFIDQFPDCTVEVYNRWGSVLFSSKGYKVPWDGTYKDGPVPVGTYYYAIELNDERFPDPYTGPVTIVR